MSKSNIKNINDFFVKKTPYLVFSKSSYSNLLLKLKKSTIWKLNQTQILNATLKNYNENNQAFYFKKYDESYNIFYRQFSRNTSVLKYSPNIVEFLHNSVEYFFFKKLYKFRVTFDGRKRYREINKHFYYSSKLNSVGDLNRLRDDLKKQKYFFQQKK